MSSEPGTRLTAAQRAERNRLIAEAHLAGAKWEPIGDRFGMSGRQARRCAKDHAESVAGLAGSPPARVGRVEGTDVQTLLGLAVYAHDVALRRGLSLLFVADNDNAYVGAMRAVSSLTGSLVGTLKALGFVGDPGLERFKAELSVAACALLDVAEGAGVPAEEALAALERVPVQQYGLVWDRGVEAAAS
jgi:hypothetical protein